MNATLTECTDCGKTISRRANKCIHCGAPNITENTLIDESDTGDLTPDQKGKNRNAIKWGIPVISLYFILVQMDILHFGKHPDFNALDVVAGLFFFGALVIVFRSITKTYNL